MIQKRKAQAVWYGFSPTLTMFVVSHTQTLLLHTPLLHSNNKEKGTWKKIDPLPAISLFPCSPIVSKPYHSLLPFFSTYICWGRTRRHLHTENARMAKAHLKNFTGVFPIQRRKSLCRNRFKHSTLIIWSNTPVRKYLTFYALNQNTAV